MLDAFLNGHKDFVISFLDGIVVSPRFQFGQDGYIENYLNLEFYKWTIEGGIISFYDSMSRKTAFIDLAHENWQGEWLVHHAPIRLKKYVDKTIYATSSDPQVLTEYLKNTRWRFRGDKGNIISDNLWLCEDGLIRGYTHENEYAWKVDEKGLNFLNIYGDITSRLGFLDIKGNRKSFYGHLNDDVNHHTLEFLSGEGSNFLSELHTTAVFGNFTDTLLVIFNGAGTPYDGIDTRWEFYHLPYKLSLDFIRFSELSPIVWYLDKTYKIKNILGNIIRQYKNVIFVGASAGGFASMYFSEILASQFAEVQFHSYVINPQTTLSINHRRHIVERFEQPLRPVLPSDFVCFNKDAQIDDIETLLSNNNDNVKHNIYYDCENPCEKFYVERLNSSHINLKGYPLNGGHADSGIKIFETQDLQRDIESLVKTKFK